MFWGAVLCPRVVWRSTIPMLGRYYEHALEGLGCRQCPQLQMNSRPPPFFFLAAPVACRSSQAEDQTRATTVTPDP